MSDPPSDLERRVAELERWRRRLDDRDLPTMLGVLAERQGASHEALTAWQVRQDAWMTEMRTDLRKVSEQTAESRGSIRTRKAVAAAAVVAIGMLLTIVGLALQALGVF